MAGKRTKIRKKIKLNKKLVCTIGVLLLIIAVISAIIMIFKPVNVGKINKEGKAEYIAVSYTHLTLPTNSLV